MRRSPTFPTLVAVILLAAAGAPCLAQKMPALGPREGTRVGDLAYDFTLKDLDGHPVHLRDLRGKSVVHLVFWATWCVPCVEEVPRLRDVYRAYRAHGLEVLGVVVPMNQTKEGVRAFVEKYHMPYPILWDGDMRLMSRYRVDSIPKNFLIGKDGVIVYAGVGLPSGYEEMVRRTLEEGASPRAAGR